MTNSERKTKGDEVLDTIIALLREEHLSRIIDEPVDRALQDFRLEITVPLTHSDFNQTISRFFCDVNRKALGPKRDLSETKAFTEAVSLLERYYRGSDSGYDGALMDAASSEGEGIEQVLSWMGETIKQVEREEYKRWVFLSNIDQLDAGGKERFVSAYRRRYKEWLEPPLSTVDPLQLIDILPELVSMVLSLESSFRQVRGATSWLQSPDYLL